MKEIQLTQGKVALVDDEDYPILSKFKWFANKSRNVYYAKRTSYSNNKKTTVNMHNEILKPEKGLECDHIDGNGLNNQKSNLRAVTIRQNQQNRHVKKSSGFPGVSFHKRYKIWGSQLRIGGKTKYLGSFATEEEAATAYQEAIALLQVK